MDEKTNKLLEEMQQATENITSHLKESAEKTKQAISDNISVIKDNSAEIREQFQQALDKTGEKIEQAAEKAEEKAREATSFVKDSVSDGKVELKLEGMKAMDEAREDFRKKYGYESGSPESEQVELKLESSQKVIDAYEKTKAEREKLQQQTSFGDNNSDMMEKKDRIIMEAGEKVQKAVESVKESKAGKAVLGDDGKFDFSDVERIADKAAEKTDSLIKKITKLFKK